MQIIGILTLDCENKKNKNRRVGIETKKKFMLRRLFRRLYWFSQPIRCLYIVIVNG